MTLGVRLLAYDRPGEYGRGTSPLRRPRLPRRTRTRRMNSLKRGPSSRRFGWHAADARTRVRTRGFSARGVAATMGDATKLRRGHGVRWTIALDGNALGVLDDPRWEEMFWCSLSVQGDLRANAPLRNDQLWAACRFEFRCRCCDAVAPNALCGGSPPFVRSGRVLMRGLVVPAARRRREHVSAWPRRLFG